jgi:hypothetical protein
MAVEKVSGDRTHWLAGHVARPAGYHLVSYSIGQVSGVPPWLYKYRLPVKVDEHTHTHTHHILEIPLANLSFLV